MGLSGLSDGFGSGRIDVRQNSDATLDGVTAAAAPAGPAPGDGRHGVFVAKMQPTFNPNEPAARI